MIYLLPWKIINESTIFSSYGRADIKSPNKYHFRVWDSSFRKMWFHTGCGEIKYYTVSEAMSACDKYIELVFDDKYKLLPEDRVEKLRLLV
jgi:hypothetical protein